MGTAYEPDDLATRAFIFSIAAIAAFIAVVFIFIL